VVRVGRWRKYTEFSRFLATTRRSECTPLNCSLFFTPPIYRILTKTDHFEAQNCFAGTKNVQIGAAIVRRAGRRALRRVIQVFPGMVRPERFRGMVFPGMHRPERFRGMMFPGMHRPERFRGMMFPGMHRSERFRGMMFPGMRRPERRDAPWCILTAAIAMGLHHGAAPTE
jgi:hypothetical protein